VPPGARAADKRGAPFTALVDRLEKRKAKPHPTFAGLQYAK